MEEWRTIHDFPNYKVSNRGRVINAKNYKLLKPFDNGTGYNSVYLYKDKKRYTKRVHRLVAEEFVDKISEGNEVNHIDGNKKNNFADNLEWCTRKENMKHAYILGLVKPDRKRKMVVILETGEIFRSISECARYINGNSSNISACLKRRRRTHKGYHYMELNEYLKSKNLEVVIQCLLISTNTNLKH
ncbi:MAG: HNH endonuclease [Candidatus Coprovivens sp.]